MTVLLRAELDPSFLPKSSNHPPVEWRCAPVLTDYTQAVDFMLKRVEEIHQGTAPELIWLVEHPPLYTAGTSAREEDLLTKNLLPVFATGRGGEYTYHGPGQRVAYIMLDLRTRRQDVRAFVGALEAWIIRTLEFLGVAAVRREDRVGVWVVHPNKKREDKIAAIGIRLKKWVSFHGVAINIAPDLSYYDGIIPCGIKGHGVTSLADLSFDITMAQFDTALKRTFHDIFG